MNKFILGLDIRTSKIGFSIVDENKNLIECGVWKYKPETPLEEKTKLFTEELKVLRRKYEIKETFVEQPFIAFSGGRTTAVTMAKLQRFNGMCCYGIFCVFGSCPELLSANETRKAGGIKRKRGEDTKKKIIEWVKNEYPEDFNYDLTRYGNHKQGPDDTADAVVVA